MTRPSAVSVAWLLVAFAASTAAQTPNRAAVFVGTWVIESGASPSGPRPPLGRECEIKIEGDRLTVVQDGGEGVVYDLRGAPAKTTKTSFGFNVTSTTSVQWRAETLDLLWTVGVEGSAPIDSRISLTRQAEKLSASRESTGRGLTGGVVVYRRK